MAERLTITSLGHEGDGIAETADGRVFVPFTLPGEVVEAEVEGERGRLTDIVEASADRIAPSCRHFGTCGNCTVQHLAPEPYRAWKRDMVVAAFAQRGIEVDPAPVVPVPPRTRRRVVFSLVKTGQGIVLGYHRRASDDILAIEECPLLVPAIERERARLAALGGRVVDRSKRARMTVTATDNGLDIAIEDARKLGRADFEALGAEASDGKIARLTVNGAEIFENRLPEIGIGVAALHPVAGGFLQATAPSENALAEAVRRHVGKAGPVVDLFAGIGTFSLRLAADMPVTAVEGDQKLLAALDRSLRHARGLKPVAMRRRDLFRNPMVGPELKPFKAVVIDPPRAGAKAQSEALAASSVPRIVAVSCNPATLARDARILIDGGYRLTAVEPVDQFLWSGHVEVVAAFERP